MKNELEKKWGFPTALSMVMGIVIGSGIFFKAVKVLSLTNGNMGQALLIIGIVGLICVVCSNVFAQMGRHYSSCNGLVDYAEIACGEKYAYFIGFFTSTIYNPVISATLSYIAASYFCMMCGLEMYGQANTGVAILFMFVLIVMNMLAPKLAGKFQVATTVIKLTPILMMGIIGSAIGLINGNGIKIFTDIPQVTTDGNGLFAGICAFSFAYEGWIAATTINSELKNPKRDLPLALTVGCIGCTVLYMLYVYSMSATMSAQEIIAAGDSLPKLAFTNIFGNLAGSLILFVIIISCLGTANGMTMSTMRGFYSLAIRGKGAKPEAVADVDNITGMPLKSCIIGIGLMGFWLFQLSTLFFQGPLAFNGTHNPEWLLAWEADEICIITIYALYIPIFVHIIIAEKNFNFLNRFILPILAIISSLFMCYCAYYAYGKQIIYYLIFFAILQGIGMYLYKERKSMFVFEKLRKRTKKED